MDALIFFGVPGTIAGLATGFFLRPGRLAVALVITLVIAVAFGIYGTTVNGETAGGWLGFVVAGFQLVEFAIGAIIGSTVRGAGIRHRGAPV